MRCRSLEITAPNEPSLCGCFHCSRSGTKWYAASHLLSNSSKIGFHDIVCCHWCLLLCHWDWCNCLIESAVLMINDLMLIRHYISLSMAARRDWYQMWTCLFVCFYIVGLLEDMDHCLAYLCWHYLLVLYLVRWTIRSSDRKLPINLLTYTSCMLLLLQTEQYNITKTFLVRCYNSNKPHYT